VSRRILLTGATGVLGSEVLDALRHAGAQVPGGPGVSPEVVAVSTRGSPTLGVVAWRMGAEPPPAPLGQEAFDVVVHCAADIRWNLAPEEARRGNVAPAEALAAVAGDDTHVVHLTSAFALDRAGSVQSDAVSDYRNTYEWSKAAAERLVRERFAPLTVVRTPFLVGRRADGGIARFHGFYTFVHGLATGLVPALVGEEEAYLDVVPVDDVVPVVVAAALGRRPESDVTVTIAGGEASLRAGEVLDIVYDALGEWRARRGCPPPERAPFLSPERWDRFYFPFVREHLTARQLKILSLLEHFRPYICVRQPLRPTVPVAGMGPVWRRSVLAWADAHPHSAAAVPRPWRGDREPVAR
jgi:nucleoside-diphosphate-sugar epimerase